MLTAKQRVDKIKKKKNYHQEKIQTINRTARKERRKRKLQKEKEDQGYKETMSRL